MANNQRAVRAPQKRRLARTFARFAVVCAFVGFIVAAASAPSDVNKTSGIETTGFTVFFLALIFGTGAKLVDMVSIRLSPVARPLPPTGTLAERVAQAQESLARTGESVRSALDATTESLREAVASTTGIVDALEEELRVRRSALDELTAQAQSAQNRAEQARELARIEESTAHALDALLDRRLAERLEAMESAGRRWDTKVTAWSLLASLPVGVAAGYFVAVLSAR